MNIYDFSETLREYFSPKIIGEVNDVYVKIAKIKGEKVPWHSHDKEDELFLIIKGSLTFEEDGKRAFTMNEGDLHIVSKGIKHRVYSVDECSILLVENKTTAHTGTVKSEITRSIEQQSK